MRQTHAIQGQVHAPGEVLAAERAGAAARPDQPAVYRDLANELSTEQRFALDAMPRGEQSTPWSNLRKVGQRV